MDRELLRSQCEEYVLGVLEGDELAQFEARLQSGDSDVRALLRESTDLVAGVGMTARPADPPVLLRSRLMNLIGPTLVMSKPAPRRNVWAFAGWAVAAALGLATLFTHQARIAGQREAEALRAELGQVRVEARQLRRVMSVVMARDAKLVRLASTAPEAPQFRAFWSRPTGLVLTGLNVPAPASGRTMQLWVVPKSGNPISAGVFAPSGDGQVMMIAESVSASPDDAAALAISDEPTGGSAQPTTKPAWVGAIGD
jgi:anti-sigma-K factor RskA